MFYKRIQRFLNRPDFQQNPLKAFLKRVLWRLRWLITNQTFIIPFAQNLKIRIPQSGSGSLIYYQGFSEPETADFMFRFLQPGMVLVDVGAHIGEYTLLAASTVKESGEVHAFEPQSKLFPLLNENVQLNNFNHVTLNRVAVSDRIGKIEFEVFDEPSVSSIRKQVATTEKKNAELVSVPSISLDEYWQDQNRKIDLIKIDVEGAEKLVFEGAKQLLELPPSEAPTWVFEYAPKSYALFNYQAQELLDLLRSFGYQIYQYFGNGNIVDFSDTNSRSGIINLIATKNKKCLLSSLQS